jgi:hypothetical protein
MDTDNGKIVRKCQLTVKDMKENITKKRNNQEMTIREAIIKITVTDLKAKINDE